jgi:hypothetical protein
MATIEGWWCGGKSLCVKVKHVAEFHKLFESEILPREIRKTVFIFLPHMQIQFIPR